MAFEFPGNPPITAGRREASLHKAWLENMVLAVQDLQQLMWVVFSGIEVGNTGVAMGFTTSATSPESMRVTVAGGIGYSDAVPIINLASWTSGTMVAPESDPRIDLVVYDANDRAPKVITGTEASSPTAPESGEGQIPLAEIHHQVDEIAIYDAETSGEGHIVDVRVMPA